MSCFFPYRHIPSYGALTPLTGIRYEQDELVVSEVRALWTLEVLVWHPAQDFRRRLDRGGGVCLLRRYLSAPYMPLQRHIQHTRVASSLHMA